MSLEDYDDYIDFLEDRAPEYAISYLSNKSNLNGKFYDNKTYKKHTSRGIARSPDHLIDNWDVEYTIEDDDWDCEITNTKMVGAWNLLDDILTVEGGTNEYVVPPHKKKMTYWYRYANHWFFNMQSRGGISGDITDAMNTLIDEASEYGMEEAIKEAAQIIKET